jgi:hypothetical protein
VRLFSVFLPYFSSKFLLSARQHSTDLKILLLISPLTDSKTNPVKLSFSLSMLNLQSHSRSAEWSTTFSLLTEPVKNLLSLDVSRFFLPTIEPFLFPSFGRAASSLRILNLPLLVLHPSSYRLALFAMCCTSLRHLSILSATPTVLREILPFFAASPLCAFTIFSFGGLTMPGIPGDPIEGLAAGLEFWPEATPEQRKENQGLSIQLLGVDNWIGTVRRLHPREKEEGGVVGRKGWRLGVMPSGSAFDNLEEIVSFPSASSTSSRFSLHHFRPLDPSSSAHSPSLVESALLTPSSFSPFYPLPEYLS